MIMLEKKLVKSFKMNFNIQNLILLSFMIF